MWNRSSFWRFASAFISQGCAGTAEQRACVLYGHTHTTHTHTHTAWVHHALSLQFTGEINLKRLSLFTPVPPSPQPSIPPSPPYTSISRCVHLSYFVRFLSVSLFLFQFCLSLYVSQMCGLQHWSTTCMLYLRFLLSLCILTRGVRYWKKIIFVWIFPITIIRRYFAECVIVLISEYRAQLQFMIFFIFCVLSSHQWLSIFSFISLN